MLNIKEIYYKSKFNLVERREFYELMAGYLDSNVNFVSALEKMLNRAKKDKNYKAYIYNDILSSMRVGWSLSRSLSKWIPESEHMLIEAGEKSAKVSDSFKEAVYLADAIGRIKKVIISTMFMPFLMIFVLFGMMVGFRVSMVHSYLEFLPLEDWKGNALTTYHMTDFVYNYWIIILSLIIGTIVLMFSTINKWHGKIRNNIFDRIPPYNIYKKFTESSFLITFAALLRANNPVVESLKGMEKNATPYLRYYLNKMLDNLSNGVSEGEALNVGLLNKQLAGHLEDTAKLANFETAVHNIGKRNIEKSVEQVAASMKVLNTILTFTVLGVVVFMFMSLQQLAFTISETIAR